MTASKRMRRYRRSNARVSGSEFGAVPRYVSLPMSVVEPSSSWFQFVGKLRFEVDAVDVGLDHAVAVVVAQVLAPQAVALA